MGGRGVGQKLNVRQNVKDDIETIVRRSLWNSRVTATFSRPVDGDGSTGPYSSQGISFRKDDSVERISSQVVWRSLGQHRWQVKSIGMSSSGDSVLAVGIPERKTMSFKGSVYDLD